LIPIEQGGNPDLVNFAQPVESVLAEDGFSEVSEDVEAGIGEGLDRPGSGFSSFPEV